MYHGIVDSTRIIYMWLLFSDVILSIVIMMFRLFEMKIWTFTRIIGWLLRKLNNTHLPCSRSTFFIYAMSSDIESSPVESVHSNALLNFCHFHTMKKEKRELCGCVAVVWFPIESLLVHTPYDFFAVTLI